VDGNSLRAADSISAAGIVGDIRREHRRVRALPANTLKVRLIMQHEY